EYLPGSLQGKISSDGCLKKEQMVVSAIASTPHRSSWLFSGYQVTHGQRLPKVYYYRLKALMEQCYQGHADENT
ncbi:hypothetical protein, partial [Shigella boydii]